MTVPEVTTLAVLAAEAADVANRVGSGRLVGGWGFIWASYAITAFTLVTYGLFLWMRRPRAPLKEK